MNRAMKLELITSRAGYFIKGAPTGSPVKKHRLVDDRSPKLP